MSATTFMLSLAMSGKAPVTVCQAAPVGAIPRIAPGDRRAEGAREPGDKTHQKKPRPQRGRTSQAQASDQFQGHSTSQPESCPRKITLFAGNTFFAQKFLLAPCGDRHFSASYPRFRLASPGACTFLPGYWYYPARRSSGLFMLAPCGGISGGISGGIFCA